MEIERVFEIASPGPLILRRPTSQVTRWPSRPTSSSDCSEPLRTLGCKELSCHTGSWWPFCLMESGLSWADHRPRRLAQGQKSSRMVKRLVVTRGSGTVKRLAVTREAGTHHLYSFQAASQGAYLFVQLSHAVEKGNISAGSMKLTGVIHCDLRVHARIRICVCV